MLLSVQFVPLFLLCTSPTWHTQAGSRPASLRARVSKPFEFEARSTASNSLSSLHFPHSPRPYRCPHAPSTSSLHPIPLPLFLATTRNRISSTRGIFSVLLTSLSSSHPTLGPLPPPYSRYRKSAFSSALRSISALLPLGDPSGRRTILSLSKPLSALPLPATPSLFQLRCDDVLFRR